MASLELDQPTLIEDAFSTEPQAQSLRDESFETQTPTKRKKDNARPPPVLNHQAELVKLITHLGHRHGNWRVFADFCEMAAISISNAVDRPQYEKREERYMQIVKGYTPDEANQLAKGLGYLVMALEENFTDVMGRTYHDLELHNKWAGQYFTPYPVCQMMAQMTMADAGDLRAKISRRGFVTAQEPACGSGAMVIALAQAMRDAGINYQEHLHVTAIDVDAKCVWMSYLQFSLLNIPAVIVHGNTLSLEEWGHWYTPAHIMGGWRWKLRRQAAIEGAHAILTVPMEAEVAPVEEVAPAMFEPQPVLIEQTPQIEQKPVDSNGSRPAEKVKREQLKLF